MPNTQHEAVSVDGLGPTSAAPKLKAFIDMARVEFGATLIEIQVPAIGLARRTRTAERHDQFVRERIFPAWSTAELREQGLLGDSN